MYPPPPPENPTGCTARNAGTGVAAPNTWVSPLLGFFFFFFWGKTGERHNLHYLLDTIILNQTKQLLIQRKVRLLHRCTLVRALPAHALALVRSKVSTVDNSNQCSRGGATSKGRRVTSISLLFSPLFFCGGERGRAAPADGIRLLSSPFCTRNKGRERERAGRFVYINYSRRAEERKSLT